MDEHNENFNKRKGNIKKKSRLNNRITKVENTLDKVNLTR